MSSSIHLTIAPGDDAPIYRQIVRQVREALVGGRLRPGDRLQSQRELAVQLVISPLTVKKAYDELERDGLIETARGQGTFVRRDLEPVSQPERREALRPAVRRLVHEAAVCGVEPGELVEMVEREAERLRSQQAQTTETEA